MDHIDQKADAETTHKEVIRKSLTETLKEWKEPTLGSLGRISIWLLFSVIIALAPIFCSYIVSPLIGQTFDFEKFASHGELAAISIALTGEALGYLLTNKKVNHVFRGIVGFGGILLFGGELILLVLVSVENVEKNISFNTGSASNLSLQLFIGTLIVGVFCKWTEK